MTAVKQILYFFTRRIKGFILTLLVLIVSGALYAKNDESNLQLTPTVFEIVEKYDIDDSKLLEELRRELRSCDEFLQPTDDIVFKNMTEKYLESVNHM